MKHAGILLLLFFLLFGCSSQEVDTSGNRSATQEATLTNTPKNTPTITPTLAPEKLVSQGKPVRVSATWVVDPPERAVNGNLNDWWGAGGEPPQWIEVDLQGLYAVSKIRIINQGPSGKADYRVIGRGLDNQNRLLHVFEGIKSENQTLEYAPETAWEDLSTIRIEINNGSGWVGLREVQVYARGDPKPLPVSSGELVPSYLSQVQLSSLEPVTPDNAIRMQPLSMLGRGTINQMVWSPDGNTLAVAGSLGVWLYDSSGLQIPPRLLEGHTRNVLEVGFSPDGKFVLSASQDGTVKKWDVASGELKRTYYLWSDFSYEVGTQDRTGEVWSMDFNSDCTQLAAGGFDGTVKIWKISSGKEIATIKGHKNSILDLAFNPEGSVLSSIDYDGNLLLWDAVQGTQYPALFEETTLVWKSVFSPDGKFLVTAGEQGIWLHDLSAQDSAPRLLEELGQYIWGMSFSPQGELLVSGSNGALQSLNLSTGEVIPTGTISGVSEIAVQPGGKLVAISTIFSELILLDSEVGLIVSKVDSYTAAITSIAFSPKGDLIASGSDDGAIRLWDPATNQLVNVLWGHMAGVTGVAFSPDGKKLASSSFDNMVSTWNIASGDPIFVLAGHGSYVRCVAFSPDGNLIASGSTDKTIRLWDAETGTELSRLIGHTAEVSSVAFSSDGSKLVSSGADFTVRLWDVETGENIHILSNHLSYVLSSNFSPDGTKVASAGGDHYLRVQNTSMGTEIFPAKGHGGWVLSTTFSPNGEILASANVSTTSYWVAPGEIHLYSSESGYPLVMMSGHPQRVTSVAFSPDGKLLASGSADGSIRLWGVPVSSHD